MLFRAVLPTSAAEQWLEKRIRVGTPQAEERSQLPADVAGS
jgi:hypothetical protein